MKGKLLQNKIAESKLTLPVTLVYAIVIWLLAGVLEEWWWLQFGCFILSALLMMQLNNIHALIRIYSRLVSCSFLLLACCASYLFPNIQSAIVQVCIISAWLLLFYSYQDKEATGWVFYAFVCIGLASIVYQQILFFLPMVWFLMAYNLQSLSWRTFLASLLGVTLPYWLAFCWFLLQNDMGTLLGHFEALADFCQPTDFSSFSDSETITLVILCLLVITGIIHCFRQKSGDKIRTRQFFGFFSWMSLFSILFIVLQPEQSKALMPILIVNASPLAGHFFALTHTKITNIAFCVTTAIILLITIFNLWHTSFLF